MLSKRNKHRIIHPLSHLNKVPDRQNPPRGGRAMAAEGTLEGGRKRGLEKMSQPGVDRIGEFMSRWLVQEDARCVLFWNTHSSTKSLLWNRITNKSFQPFSLAGRVSLWLRSYVKNLQRNSPENVKMLAKPLRGVRRKWALVGKSRVPGWHLGHIHESRGLVNIFIRGCLRLKPHSSWPCSVNTFLIRIGKFGIFKQWTYS